ncbi:MAG: hypothetical protein HKM95_05925 [Inquilinus sp.]|nr:hypothetical protein [Inquilinus sp.]
MGAPRLLLHAPTAGALARARSNAANVIAADPTAEVRIVANAEAVAAALAEPEPRTDPLLLLCGNTLRRLDREAPARLATVPVAMLAIAERVGEGWIYVRA